MLITFKSKSTADVTMYAEHAKPILDLLDKEVTRGVITPAEMGPAIYKLEMEIHARHKHTAAEDVMHDVHTHGVENHHLHHHDASHDVSFSARCYPFLEMLRASMHDKNDILWGGLMPTWREKVLRAADGSALYVRDWHASPGAPWNGSLLIMHGLGEHGGRYEAFAQFCNAQGFSVRAYDHRGHGASSGKRGDIPHPLCLLDDAQIVIDDLRQESGTPPVLLGHSMGGLFAARLTTAKLAPIRALILSSPALAIRLHGAQKLFLSLLKHTLPHLGIPNHLPLRYLSHNPEVARAYLNDALVHNKISASLLQDMLDAMDFCHTQAPTLDVPVLIQVAGDDHLVDMQGSLHFYSKLPQKWATLLVYPPLYHEIFNEQDATSVYGDLGRWLHKLPKVSPSPCTASELI